VEKQLSLGKKSNNQLKVGLNSNIILLVIVNHRKRVLLNPCSVSNRILNEIFGLQTLTRYNK
jgi:hypothetical protein